MPESPSTNIHFDYVRTNRYSTRRSSAELNVSFRKMPNAPKSKTADLRAPIVKGRQASKSVQQRSNQEVTSLKRRLQIEGMRREESKQKHDARSVICALEERRSMQLSNVIQMAESAVEKGNDVIESLVAQREVIRNIREDLLSAEDLIHDVRGIMTFSGKLANMVGTSNTYDVDIPENSRKRISRRSSLPDLLPSYFSKRDHSEHYSHGVRKLNNILDSLHKQHRDLYGELQDQEKYLAEVGFDMDRLSSGMYQQAKIMKIKMRS